MRGSDETKGGKARTRREFDNRGGLTAHWRISTRRLCLLRRASQRRFFVSREQRSKENAQRRISAKAASAERSHDLGKSISGRPGRLRLEARSCSVW